VIERIGALAAAAAALLAAGCGSGASHALYSTTIPWGEGITEPAGQVWAASGVALCTKGHAPVTLTSITPVSVRGEIHFDGSRAKRGVQGELAFQPGTPFGSRPVNGFVIPSPSPCRWPRPTSPLYEAIVLAHATGSHGGSIVGLRVRYRVGRTPGAYTIPFTYRLR